MTPPPPVDPPPRVFWQFHSPTDFWIWVELRNVFATAEPHSCSCGIGFQNPLPPEMASRGGAVVGIYDTVLMQITGEVGTFTDHLLPSTPATDGWRAGPQMPDPLTGTPEVDNWLGFGGEIAPTQPPVLGPNEIFVLCFQFDVPAGSTVQRMTPGKIGGGLGNPDFSPLFGMRPDADSHFAAYSALTMFPLVPSPGAAGVMLGIGVLATRRQRR